MSSASSTAPVVVPYRETVGAQDTAVPYVAPTGNPRFDPLPVVHRCPPEEAAAMKAHVAAVSAAGGHVDLAHFSRSPIPYLVSTQTEP